MARPLLGVMVGTHTPPALRRLLVAASDMCRPVACSAHEPLADVRPAAYLWCGASARPPASVPYAAWVSRLDDLAAPVARQATVLLTETAALVDLAPMVYVPADTGANGARPTPPFVRRRLRQARGLPDVVVACGDGERWFWGQAPDPLDPDLADTAAGCASAVVATGAALRLALAWAAPTVTDPVSAAELGAVDGTHLLVVADPAARLDQALALGTDDARAARLGWSGYLLARERCDVHHAAWTMLTALGLPTRAVDGGLAPLEHQLDVLGTPAYAPVRLRARSHTTPLPLRVPAEGVL